MTRSACCRWTEHRGPGFPLATSCLDTGLGRSLLDAPLYPTIRVDAVSYVHWSSDERRQLYEMRK